ncbi:MAG: hypothetical protein CSA22_10685 [Deltaproteobacteria bacterium]|nr:MAG: hypothetical protein CSA22_10685 [Deltaproteobacteria bacterium]
MRHPPEIAILGHPNEGKSAVVSTLAEDDSVRVSPVPGETTTCRMFPVYIDGVEVIRFTDTPGFQSPRQMLKHLQADTGDPATVFDRFSADPLLATPFRDEIELLKPVLRGAGIIYVADGSRPVRHADRAEMEILRMAGNPRMAVINLKSGDIDFSEDWKQAFRQHFNVIRFFNAHTARFQERIALLDSLKVIDPDWEPLLSQVVTAVTEDWTRRIHGAADDMVRMLTQCLTHKEITTFTDRRQKKIEQKHLFSAYTAAVRQIEEKALEKIRKRFRHRLYQPALPEGSILQDGLFDKQTWRLAGLTPAQVTATAAVCGSAAGVAVDLATLGHSLGAFTAMGGILGAGAAWFKGEKLLKTKVAGLPIGGYRMVLGPHKNIQFLFVLLDRAMVYCSHIAAWSHGRRDYPDQPILEAKGRVRDWSADDRKVCQDFFTALASKNSVQRAPATQALKALIITKLTELLS